MSASVLGVDVESGDQVTIDDDARLRGLYIIGTNGTGKTTLIESMVLQDVANGFGACVLDPHGDLVTNLLERIPVERERDVVLLDPRDSGFPFGLNPLWCDNPSDRELVDRMGAQFVELIEKLWGPKGTEGTSWGPRIPQTLRNVSLALLENPGHSMLDFAEFVWDKSFRQSLLANVTNPEVIRYWRRYDRLSERIQDERTDSTLNKLDEFATQRVVANIVGQSETTANFREFMDEGKIVLVPLGIGKLGAPVVSLLGSLIVLQILNAALSRENLSVNQRRQFRLYADEFQQFATPAFASLLTEARKYGVSTTIAHQVRGQLDSDARDATLNAGSIVVFAVHGEDANELAQQFDRTPPPAPLLRDQRVRAPSRTPTELVLRGHRSSFVRDYALVYIEPLIDYYKELGHDDAITVLDDSHGFPRWGSYRDVDFDRTRAYYYHASKDVLREGKNLLDHYLYHMMANSKQDHVEATYRYNIMCALRAFYGIAERETVSGIVRDGADDIAYRTSPPDGKFPAEFRQEIPLDEGTRSALWRIAIHGKPSVVQRGSFGLRAGSHCRGHTTNEGRARGYSRSEPH